MPLAPKSRAAREKKSPAYARIRVKSSRWYSFNTLSPCPSKLPPYFPCNRTSPSPAPNSATLSARNAETPSAMCAMNSATTRPPPPPISAKSSAKLSAKTSPRHASPPHHERTRRRIRGGTRGYMAGAGVFILRAVAGVDAGRGASTHCVSSVDRQYEEFNLER